MNERQVSDYVLVLMKNLNLLIILYMAGILSASLYGFVEAGTAYDFLLEAPALPLAYWKLPLMALGLYGACLLLMSVRSDRASLVLLKACAEIVLGFLISSVLSFGYMGVILLILADTMKYFPKSRLKFPAAVVICLALVVTSALRTGKEETIHIATKPMTEQYVMGEMLKLLIEQDTDLTVELTQGVGGGTSNIQPAMEGGEFDIYPEYTGTAWNMVLKNEDVYTEDLFDQLQQEYEENYSMEWRGMYGFNNTYGMVVRREIAEQYDLHTYSDLAAVADQLVFGAEYDFFEREDGYDALCDIYGLNFRETMDLDIGLKYQALEQEQIDVMVVFTTDGQLSASDAVVLEDDKQFYPSYLCGNVVRGEVLEEYPELNRVFEKVTGLISDSDMAQMNYEVETENREPEDVAEEYLDAHGLLE